MEKWFQNEDGLWIDENLKSEVYDFYKDLPFEALGELIELFKDLDTFKIDPDSIIYCRDDSNIEVSSLGMICINIKKRETF